MLWAKLVLPVLMVTGGTGFAVAAYVGDNAATAGPSRVWIDGPPSDGVVAPGQVVVTAHATAENRISALDLYVDDQKVATDRTLRTTDKLVFARFRWDAVTKGEHELVVRQVGGSDGRSDPLFVTIGTEPSDPGTAPPAPTSTTTTPSSSTTIDEAPTVVETIPPAPSPTSPPPTAPPNTTPPPAASVFIDSASLDSTNENRVYLQACYQVRVSARIRGAEYASAVIDGTGAEVELTADGSTWTGVITGGPMFDSGDVGSHQVTVIAGSGDEVVDGAAGTVTIIANCPKD